MSALIMESKVTRQSRNQSRSRRLALDLCGPYVFDEVDARHVRCSLRINHTKVAVNIPADVLRKQRRLGDRRQAALHVAGEHSVAFEFKPILTDRQLQTAAILSAEMSDFDRY